MSKLELIEGAVRLIFIIYLVWIICDLVLDKYRDFKYSIRIKKVQKTDD